MSQILNLQHPLREAVSAKFSKARASQEVIFSDTHLSLLQTPNWPAIQLRYCPALGKKPQKGSNSNDTKKPFDPFEDPSPDLLVVAIPSTKATHNLVLNKYPVIPNHFIIATIDNKPQTKLLEEDDLFLTYACVQAWEDKDHALYAFFNSGEHSGASQPHRHLQFLPVEDMKSQQAGWEMLCSTATTEIDSTVELLRNPALPFVHFALPLQRDLEPREVHKRYLLLIKAWLALKSGRTTSELESMDVDMEADAPFSYNLCLTSSIMAILPRRHEGSSVPGVSDSFVAINGTILAGTMMVKSEQEWETLKQKPDLVRGLMEDITYPWEQASKYSL